ncbi:MAG: hypothetical protein JNJ54_09995 [Myxococcaceae bacterium]|nr:hypothetical protein [Myxococcaceae bacterium]
MAVVLAVCGCVCNAPCPPGQAACACLAGNQCNDGLACGADGKCAAPTLAGVVVSDPAARGCEVLLTEAPGTVITSGQFSGGVVGTSIREAPKVALTFVAPGDAPFPAGGVQLALAQGATSGVTVTKASCVDVKGARLAGATVTIR